MTREGMEEWHYLYLVCRCRGRSSGTRARAERWKKKEAGRARQEAWNSGAWCGRVVAAARARAARWSACIPARPGPHFEGYHSC
jgi:hypothetical protein